MEEENLLPEGGEGEVVHEEHDDPKELVSAEELAVELGWSPKDQWRGEESDWKPATDFLKRTVEVNRAVRKENKQISDKLSRLERTTGVMIDRVRQEEKEKLEAKFKEAVDVGDHETARELGKQLDEPAPQGGDPDVQAFVTKHSSWYDKDPVATQAARVIASQAAAEGLSVSEQLERVEAQISRRFPEYFDAPKPQAKPPASVSEPMGRTARTPASGRPKGYSDLPADARKAADDFERKAGVPKEQFAAEYWKENA